METAARRSKRATPRRIDGPGRSPSRPGIDVVAPLAASALASAADAPRRPNIVIMLGDPTFEFNVNVVGPGAQNNLVDALRYEPGFSLDLIVDLAVPIGEYDSDQPLNVGQNRWYGRVGVPIVWQLGPWVPGRRTTVEFLPAVWLFGDNDDYVGQTLETDPMYQLDAHLTRDLTERLWGGLDGTWYTGGTSSIDGVEGEKLDNLAFGLTLGYQINDNLGLSFGYKSTVSDSDPADLRMDGFMVTLVSGWHPLVEGARRLQSE